MEASEILKREEDAFYDRFFIVDVIVSDNDGTMQAVLKHLMKVPEVKLLSHPKEKLIQKSLSHTSLRTPPIA